MTRVLATLGAAIQNQLGGVNQTDLLDSDDPWSLHALED